MEVETCTHQANVFYPISGFVILSDYHPLLKLPVFILYSRFSCATAIEHEVDKEC